MSYTDSRLIGGLAMPSAPPLDDAGVETTSEPEPMRARAVRVFWRLVVVAELVAVRMSLPPQASRREVDSILTIVGVEASLGMLSALPWLRWLEHVRPKASRVRSIRLGMAFVAIQVFVLSALARHETPGWPWFVGGLLLMILAMVNVAPWLDAHWPKPVRFGSAQAE